MKTTMKILSSTDPKKKVSIKNKSQQKISYEVKKQGNKKYKQTKKKYEETRTKTSLKKKKTKNEWWSKETLTKEEKQFESIVKKIKDNNAFVDLHQQIQYKDSQIQILEQQNNDMYLICKQTTKKYKSLEKTITELEKQIGDLTKHNIESPIKQDIKDIFYSKYVMTNKNIDPDIQNMILTKPFHFFKTMGSDWLQKRDNKQLPTNGGIYESRKYKNIDLEFFFPQNQENQDTDWSIKLLLLKLFDPQQDWLSHNLSITNNPTIHFTQALACRPGGWLDDGILNLYLATLNEESKMNKVDVMFINSYRFETIHQKNEKKGWTSFFDQFRNHNNHIFVINENKKHWYLIECFDIKTEGKIIATIIDSNDKTRYNIKRNVKEKLTQFYNQEIIYCVAKTNTVEVQFDTHNCGVYVLRRCKYYAKVGITGYPTATIINQTLQQYGDINSFRLEILSCCLTQSKSIANYLLSNNITI